MLLFVHAGPALDAVGYRAVVLRDAKDRGHTLDALRQRLAFEDLLTRVASSFIHRPAHEVDECIAGALADIGSFVGVDRAYIFVARDDRGILENTHEWTANEVPTEIDALRAVPRNELPEWVGTLERLEVIYIPRVADLGDQWRHEVDLLKPQGVRSVLAVPLADEGRLIGFIGFDLVERERIWSDDHIAVLSSAAGIISQALARSDAEQRFGLAFTNAPLGMVLSGPDGRHIQVNQAYCELVGRTEAELIGVPASDLLHPDDVALLTEDHVRVVRGGLEQTSLELRVLRPDGETIWVRLHISAVRGGDKKLRYTVSHVEDITERHRQEHELRVSEERYRTLVENSPAFVTRFDRDLRLVYASPRCSPQSTDVHVGSVVGRDGQRVRRDRRRPVERSIRQVFDSGRRLDTEWEVWTTASSSGSRPGPCPSSPRTAGRPRPGHDHRHHRAQAHRGRAGAPGAARSADRPGQPGPPARPAEPHPGPARPTGRVGRRCSSSTSTGSRSSTTRSATPPATSCSFAMAERLVGALRPDDIVARLGGDEFVVLLDGLDDLREPVSLAQRIHRALKEPVDGRRQRGLHHGQHRDRRDHVARRHRRRPAARRRRGHVPGQGPRP